MISTLHIVVAMKPLEGNFVQNALRYGVAGINVDGCRIGTVEVLRAGAGGLLSNVRDQKDYPAGNGYEQAEGGRWPANVILGHLEGCRCIGTKKVKADKNAGFKVTKGRSWKNQSVDGINRVGYADSDGKETTAAWECEEGCPVKAMDKQSGDKCGAGAPVKGTEDSETGQNGIYGRYKRVATVFHNDGIGGASRFFKQVKS